MTNQDKQIDKLFKTGLGNYEETPSSSAWNAINNQLPKKNNWYWVAASVAILLVSAIGWNTIINHSNPINYEISNTAIKANYPQKEFIPLPVIIQTKTIVYIEKQVLPEPEINVPLLHAQVTDNTKIKSAFDLKPISDYYALSSTLSESASVKLIYSESDPITIIYKKGNPKHPMLAKAASFFKEVGEGERPLIDFEKLSTNVLARRETNNNSNN